MLPFNELFGYLIHFDHYLGQYILDYGILIYFILFTVIFVETGIVFFPFLPGDSLIFVAGAFAASGYMSISLLFLLFALASILGDSVNYFIGGYLGPRVFKYKDSLLFKHEYLDRTRKFFDRYGSKTIVIARFIPIVRTFAPFLAGIGKMEYVKFLSYNLIGGILWVGLFVFLGYFFGNMPLIKDNLSLVVLIIIGLSIVPAIYEYIRAKMNK